MNEYVAGTLVRSSVVFQAPDINGVLQLTDPTTILFSYRTPQTGTIVAVTYPAAGITRDGLGKYHADIPTNAEAGEYWYRWEGTGACQSATEANFYIPRSNIV